MQKFLNDPDEFVDDVLHGVLAAHPRHLTSGTAARSVIRANPPRDQVPIVTGGGSGHLPLFFGYVGDGLVTAAAVGGVFNSPSADLVLSCIRDVDNGSGVLLLYGNYGGDVMNFDLAAELAAAEGIRTVTMLAADDVASAPLAERHRRRGVAGIALLYKLAGAASARGDSLDTISSLLQRATDRLVTVGVALSPCILPAVGRPTFELPAGQMEIGAGLHGEPGVRRESLTQASVIVNQVLELLLNDNGPVAGDRVALLVNGLGSTPLEELYLISGICHDQLRKAGIEVVVPFVGNFATSLEMGGASVSLLPVDDEMQTLLGAPCHAPVMTLW
ncbi:dihydroxyacetone kinase [Mycobacterium sp. MS1601]|uniref:dihydroxyacetone kinase subunit DhaK n=1 Tax=Mycobacterium sp. MS1601 TaxID=1936029 RepID=UPI0009795F29|nr:dihydroxyacetone kinase subunit DhaK [Mycobacterium sp. MS1601]AQA02765.1 dihydroxyacetone kinase [Mycobacterium sp. MS1601]